MDYLFPEIFVEMLYREESMPWRIKLLHDLPVTLSNGTVIIIPSGFISDGASVPNIFKGIISNHGDQLFAVLVHDWLYDTRFSIFNDDRKDRLFADDEMMYFLRLIHELHGDTLKKKAKRRAMYTAVRVGGKSWWDNNSYPYYLDDCPFL